MSKWTGVLLSAGLISIPAVMRAEEAPQPNTVLTSLSSTTLSGYIDTSAVWKFGTGDANMPGRVYDGADVQDGFNLNVVSLTLDKPLSDSQWAAGYHIQMLMGPGAYKRGTGLISSFSSTEFSFNEAYINLRVPVGNGLELHVGQFGTYNGYEAFDSYKDPNWSRSYGFYIESSAHTGISGSYRVNDNITLMAGIGNAAAFNNQVDARQAYESKKAYLTMISLTAPDSFGFLKGASLSAGYTVGDHQLDTTGNSSTYSPAGGSRWNQGNIYVGGSMPTPMTGLSLGFAYDYTYGITAPNSYANATALYLSFASGKWTFNNRVDYATGSNGSFGYIDTSASHPRNQLISETFTVGYSLWKNVLSRVEFRWDHDLTDSHPFGGKSASYDSGEGWVNNGSQDNSFSLSANIVYLF